MVLFRQVLHRGEESGSRVPGAPDGPHLRQRRLGVHAGRPLHGVEALHHLLRPHRSVRQSVSKQATQFRPLFLVSGPVPMLLLLPCENVFMVGARAGFPMYVALLLPCESVLLVGARTGVHRTSPSALCALQATADYGLRHRLFVGSFLGKGVRAYVLSKGGQQPVSQLAFVLHL